jgi:polyisoprenoid-binding protein YceI
MKRAISARIRFTLVAAITVATVAFTTNRLQAQAPEPRREARNMRLRAGEIDTDLSRVFIFVDKTGFGHQHAVVGRLKSGYLRVAKEAAGKILFDMPTFRADTLDARRKVGLEGASSEDEQEQVTANMTGESVLDVAHFPTALFAVTSVRRFDERGLKQYSLDGDFTLHGVTRAINITATGEQEQGYLHLKGHFPLRQTDFGIRPFKKALGAVGVGDVLTVYGDLWIKQ